MRLTRMRSRRSALLLFILYISSCASLASVNGALCTGPTCSPRQSNAQILALTKRQVDSNPVEPLKKHNKKKRKAQYEFRKQQWLERYGSVQALKARFGAREGDLSPAQTRRLYHTLLPRSLLGLYEMGLMKPEELAPLAYQARIAAKQYARSRCVWYARLATQVFDQYRNLRDKGRLASQSSPTWDEIWSKYEAQIVQEECTKALEEEDDDDQDDDDEDDSKKRKKWNEKDLTLRIYLRILEKSTATNRAFDQMFLNSTTTTNYNKNIEILEEELDPLAQMSRQLDQDVQNLLLGPKESAKALKRASKWEIQRAKEERKAQEKQQKQQHKMEKKRQEELEKMQREEEERLEEEQKRAEKRLKLVLKTQKEKANRADKEEEDLGTTIHKVRPPKGFGRQRWQVLKIMAGTRRKFRALGEMGKLVNDQE